MPHDFVFGLCLVASLAILVLLVFLGWGTLTASRRVFSGAFGDSTDRDRWLFFGLFLAGILMTTFIVSMQWGMETMMGVLAAGAILGVLCSPFTVRRYRREGVSLAAGAVVLTILAGACASIFCTGMLVVFASD